MQCNEDIHVVTDSNSVIVEWNTTDMFSDEHLIVSIESNFHSGQAFTVGAYHVIYVATDVNHNIGKCEFDLNVGYQTAIEPVKDSSVDVSYHLVDESIGIKNYSTIKCIEENTTFALPTPPFYVADMLVS